MPPGLRWIFVVLAIVVVIDAQLYHLAAQARRDVSAQGAETLRTASSLVLGRAEQLFDLYDRTLSGLGEALALREGFRGEEGALRRLLLRRHEITPGLHWLVVARENGDLAASSLDLPAPGRNFADREYFQTHLARGGPGLHVGTYLVGQTTGLPFIPVSRAAVDEGGRLLGVVAAGVDPSGLRDLLVEQRLPPGYTLRLFRRSGEPLACLPECDERDWGGTALFTSLLDGAPNGHFRTGASFGDSPGAGAYVSSTRFPIVVAASVDERTLLEPWRDSVFEYAAAAVSSNVAIAVIAAFAFRQTRRRRQAMQALAGANAFLEERVARRTDELRISEARARLFMNTATDGVIVFDDAGRIVEFNGAAERMFGYDAAEASTMTLDALIPDFAHVGTDDSGAARDPIGRAKYGREFDIEITVGATAAEAPGLHVGIVRDISERRAIERELQRLATRDALTGVLNRGAWTAKASQLVTVARRYRRPLTLMVIDADRFKQINDNFGHATGDAVLRALAATLEQSVRGCDVVGRLGGEEFGVALPETELEAACELGRRLLDNVRACRPRDGGHELSFTVSIGATRFDPESDADLDAAFRRADRALYRAKADGRDRLVCIDDDRRA